ncbi:hypothetical protein HGI32_15260 [Clostridium acetobutylicum]|uniref:Predicted membrane protein n=2 Tax=Clostridiaceae TaxID=31979 RepID=Q97K77_CLOAB|nr:Predicted membrane protein [Clostridium acetobutylicum ATCC 824]AEI31573.1 hypothetical protein SMB_G1060 [Clostridium acetobutylicum DSM 1731]AWV81726.1 hypothetical protein DK921_16850 [Clostridium acetobutylicum]PSM05011.1 hypothetical protein C7T89_16845 [Clostridium sp. NJ4]MBC2395268.1 hypothetical protein [Clostridium acetobutylicum]
MHMAFSIKTLAILFLLMIAVMSVYNFTKRFFISKLNKWVILAFIIIMFFAANIIGARLKIGVSGFNINQIVYYAVMALFLFGLYAFFDVVGWSKTSRAEKRNTGKKMVIKPKAKPNRVKKKDGK